MPGRSYDLVRQTPGGNPGDGSINGNLTISTSSALGASANNSLTIGRAPGDSGAWIDLPTNGPSGIGTGGNGSNPLVAYVSQSGNYVDDSQPGDTITRPPSGNAFRIGFGSTGGPSALAVQANSCPVVFGVKTKGLGLAPLYGDDVRTGLTAADASATTLYTTTAAGQLYRLMGRILATAGTSPSATYTIKWTEGGATITKTLTISALDSDSDLSILIQPDNGTAITAQLTAISGTGTTVNVAATVEQMA